MAESTSDSKCSTSCKGRPKAAATEESSGLRGSMGRWCWGGAGLGAALVLLEANGLLLPDPDLPNPPPELLLNPPPPERPPPPPPLGI
eukprot:CAMPEP_0168341252 /NCGR_PEP_ID=MMETSP0213-20121227/14560_1 /TAXON_ID=151035 /ORGANISM="Euplotes harpa, Strain FSP1.4" /LENGTH=87 /DNA_ID=CAMNT_0008347667 /DNA_START=129 /DNA_END=393 /DNA_ORIENTATION=-